MIDTLTRSLTAEPQTAFRNLITEPLESVLGRPLLSVSYWLLDYDQAEFSVEQPNEIGILFVSLQFGGGTLELSWGFDKSLRGNDLAYHIQVVPAGQAGSLARMDTGSLFEIAEVRASPWQEVIGKRLTGVEAVGLQGSPQAVRFSLFLISFTTPIFMLALSLSRFQLVLLVHTKS